MASPELVRQEVVRSSIKARYESIFCEMMELHRLVDKIQDEETISLIMERTATTGNRLVEFSRRVYGRGLAIKRGGQHDDGN